MERIAQRDRLTRRYMAHQLVSDHHATEAVGKKGNGFRWYWLAWASVSLIAFLVPELWVATHGKMNLTLSDTLRAIMGIDPPSKSRAVRAWSSLAFALVVVGGGGVLTMHITAGWPW